MAWVKFVICLFFGFFGVHKFMEKKIGMGILYLFTVGLFGFGWLYDCGKYLIAAIKSTKFKETTANVPVEPMAQMPLNSNSDHLIERPSSNPIKTIKKILLWAVTGLFALFALAFLLSGGVLAGLLAAAFVALVIPIDCWQNTLKTFIKGKIKAIVAVVLAILFFVAVPPAETTDAEVSTPSAVTATTTEAPTEAPTEALTEASTEAPTEAPTEASTEAPTEASTEAPTEVPTEASTEAPTEASTETPTEPVTEPIKDDGRDYVLNTNTKKFHYPSCSSADDIKAKNRKEFHGTRDEVIKKGYEPCGRCHP